MYKTLAQRPDLPADLVSHIAAFSGLDRDSVKGKMRDCLLSISGRSHFAASHSSATVLDIVRQDGDYMKRPRNLAAFGEMCVMQGLADRQDIGLAVLIQHTKILCAAADELVEAGVPQQLIDRIHQLMYAEGLALQEHLAVQAQTMLLFAMLARQRR